MQELFLPSKLLNTECSAFSTEPTRHLLKAQGYAVEFVCPMLLGRLKFSVNVRFCLWAVLC